MQLCASGMDLVQCLPQRLRQLLGQAWNRVGVGQEAAVLFDGVDLSTDLVGDGQASRMIKQAFHLSPARFPGGDQLRPLLPLGRLLLQRLELIDDGFELVIADTMADVLQMDDGGRRGQRWNATGLCRRGSSCE